MHVLQSKHRKLNAKEVQELLLKLNISINQLPKIMKDDKGLPEGCNPGDVVEIERKIADGKERASYFRLII